jgi:hypothetical protein
MQCLEVSCVVRPICGSLGAKALNANYDPYTFTKITHKSTIFITITIKYAIFFVLVSKFLLIKAYVVYLELT